MKKVNKLFIVVFIIFFFINVFVISPIFVSASEKQGTGGKYYCPLCEHRSDSDPLYRKERQFYRKIELLKEAYGDSIDEIALAASVLHRYGKTDTYNALYTDNFNEEEYKNTAVSIRKAFSSSDLTDEERKLVEANEKYDLLTLAAILMNDASKGGTYSDVCFKDALAGDRLVANDSDGLFGKIFNAVICAKTKLDGSDSSSGDSEKVRNATEKLRIANIKYVCENGYVGGLYGNISEIQDEARRQAFKDTYAQQIIDMSNYYKKLYSI